jgi:hypothetical protein
MLLQTLEVVSKVSLATQSFLCRAQRSKHRMQCELILVPSATRRAQRVFNLAKCPGGQSNSVRALINISDPIDLLHPEQGSVVRAGFLIGIGPRESLRSSE